MKYGQFAKIRQELITDKKVMIDIYTVGEPFKNVLIDNITLGDVATPGSPIPEIIKIKMVDGEMYLCLEDIKAIFVKSPEEEKLVENKQIFKSPYK